MDSTVIAALQLHQYGLTPIPLYQKKPLIDAWPTRFINNPLSSTEILNGLMNSDGSIIRYNNKNIGIVTGKVSNCIVLDIDNMSLLTKLETLGPLPDTWTTISNRGIHLYFQYREGIPSFKLWGSIDVLSDKKQVVAPPSIHPSGKKYKWELSPKDIGKAELPKWLLEYLINYSNQSKNTNTKTSYRKTRNFKSKEVNKLLQNIDWFNFYSQVSSNIKGRGEWLSSTCPFHNDTHNSFSFNTSNGSWKCFAGCGSGSGFKAIQVLYNLTPSQTIRLIKGETIYV